MSIPLTLPAIVEGRGLGTSLDGLQLVRLLAQCWQGHGVEGEESGGRVLQGASGRYLVKWLPRNGKPGVGMHVTASQRHQLWTFSLSSQALHVVCQRLSQVWQLLLLVLKQQALVSRAVLMPALQSLPVTKMEWTG